MKTSKRYADVLEMVRDLAGPNFAKKFEEHMEARSLTQQLTLKRVELGLTLSQVTSNMNVGYDSYTFISDRTLEKMEYMADQDVGLVRIKRWAKALGGHLEIVFDDSARPHQ